MEIFKKICLLGDGAVGKTSLIRRFVYDIFDDEYISTIGTKVTKKWVETIKGVKVNLFIWDILGQKKHKDIHSTYYKGASGVIVVCDLTKKETFENMDNWIYAFMEVVGETHLMLIGNKSDLENMVVVREKTINEKASELNVPCFITSAKTGKNVEKAFRTLADLVVGL